MEYTPYNNDQYYYQEAPQPDYGYYEADYSALTRARWAIFGVLFTDMLMWIGSATSLEFAVFISSPLMVAARMAVYLLLFGLAAWQISTFPARAWRLGGYILMGWGLLFTVGSVFARGSITAGMPGLIGGIGAVVVSALSIAFLAYGLAALCHANGTSIHKAAMIVAFAMISCALEYAAIVADGKVAPGTFRWLAYLEIISIVGMMVGWWKFLKRSMPEPDGAYSDFEVSDLFADHRAAGILLALIAMAVILILIANISMTVNIL